MDEHDEHQDLRGLSRRSVIPYVHGRMGVVLLKHCLFRLPCVALRVLTPVVAFYSTRLLRSHYAPGDGLGALGHVVTPEPSPGGWRARCIGARGDTEDLS
jgi:hypothetical protein